MKKIVTLALFCGTLLFCSDNSGAGKGDNLKQGNPLMEWLQLCRGLTRNRSIDRVVGHEVNDSAFGPDKKAAWEKFAPALSTGIEAMVDEVRRGNRWLDAVPPCVKDQTMEVNYDTKLPFVPFTQRLELSPGEKVVLFGDRHGDCHSLANDLEDLCVKGLLDGNFKLSEGVCMAFLGDYVDRGNHGAEVILTLLALKNVNPDRVFLVRGNHEDVGYQQVHKTEFVQECINKFGEGEGDVALRAKQISTIYELMPLALYLGCGDSYVQCNHGGMEPGYNPSWLINSNKDFQLIGELKRTQGVVPGKEYSLGDMRRSFEDIVPRSPEDVNFLWGDYNPDSVGNFVDFDRSIRYAKGAVQELLELQNRGRNKVRSVLRAHQHGSCPNGGCLMPRILVGRGLCEVWQEPKDAMYPEARTVHDGLVSTFNVAPDTNIGGAFKFDFDTYGILTVAERYEDWRMQVVNTGGKVLTEDTPMRAAEEVLSRTEKPVVPQRLSAEQCRASVAGNPGSLLHSGPSLHSLVDSDSDSDSDSDGGDGEHQRRELPFRVGSVDDDGAEMALASILAGLEESKDDEQETHGTNNAHGSLTTARTELATTAVIMKQAGAWMNSDGSFEVEL